MNIYLDTELVMAFLFDRSEYSSEVDALAEIMSDVKVKRYCTVFCIERMFHIAGRRAGGTEAFKAVLSRFMRSVKPLDVLPDDIMCAVNSNVTDFEKAVMFYSSFRKGPGIILAVDNTCYEGSPIPVMTPTEYLSKYCF